MVAVSPPPSAVKTVAVSPGSQAASPEATSTAAVVATLLAASAGAEVHLHAMGTGAAAPAHEIDCSAGPLLLPIDFSAAAHPDAPLAPRDGADAFDERLEQALTGPLDGAELRALTVQADRFAAELDPLGQVDPEGLRGAREAAVDVHRVRYRVIRLEARADGRLRP